MIDQEEGWVSPGVLAKQFKVHPKTISRWADAGKIEVKRTLNGHRRVRVKVEVRDNGDSRSTTDRV